MMLHRDHPVVVGVDGSEAGWAAVRLAGVEALLRGDPVELVAAFRPHPDDVRRAAAWTPRATARRWLVDATAAVKAVHAHVRVRTELAIGELANVLIDRSRDAGLLVVASGSPVTGWQRVIGNCGAPVIAVGPGCRSGGPVVVGVDGVTVSEAAVDFGYAEAARRGVSLVAVHVWTGLPCTALSAVDPFAYDVSVARSEADRVLAEGLAGWSEKYPDVPVERRVVLAAHVGEGLVGPAAGAAMLVIGARSSAVPSDQRLGPVTRFALRHAACPVAVLNPAGL